MVTADNSFTHEWDKGTVNTVLRTDPKDPAQALVGNITLRESGINQSVVLLGGAVHIPGVDGLAETASEDLLWMQAYDQTLRHFKDTDRYSPTWQELRELLPHLFTEFLTQVSAQQNQRQESAVTQRLGIPAAAGIFVVALGTNTPHIFWCANDESDQEGHSNVIAEGTQLGKGKITAYSGSTKLEGFRDADFTINASHGHIRIDNIFEYGHHRARSIYRFVQAMVTTKRLAQMPNDLRNSNELKRILSGKEMPMFAGLFSLLERETYTLGQAMETMGKALKPNIYADLVPGIAASFAVDMKRSK